ncbi:MAG: hypothetical protein HLX50_08355, partial [Alteromonadaceae bacterium]|nr:hypothetical protein [Alteromonadaceae bacterium]
DKSLDGVNRSGRGTASGMAALTTAGDEANRMFKLQKGALQQAGYQIQDFTVQVSSGTSAFVALGQQGSQLLGLLGPGGALLGAVLAIGSVVGGVLVNSFSDGENAVDALDAAMDRLNKTVEESDGLPVLTQQIRDLARESEVAARARISAAMQDAQNASEAAAKGIGEAFGELPIVSWFDPLTRDIDELTRSIGWFEAYLQTGQAQDQLTELGEMFGLSGDRAKQAGRQIGEMLTQLRANPSVENFQALENAMGSLIQEGGKPSQGILQLVGNLGTYFDTAREAADRTAFLQKALENLGVAAGDQGVADDVDQMISSLEDKANAVGKTAREIAVLKAEQLRDDGADAKAIQTLLDQIDATYDAIEAEKARQQALKDSANAEQQYNQWIDSLTASIDPLQQAEEEIAKIWKAFEAGDLEGIGRSQVQDYVDAMREGIKTSGEAADEYDQWVQNLTNSIDPLQKAEKEIAKIWAAFEAGDLGDIDRTQVQDYVDAMREGAMGVTDAWTDAGKAMDQFADSTSNSLRTLQGLFEEGDSGYKALAVGIQALNTLQAVNAVLNQSSGDPYSAWGRMAAMAATVASLGYAVGSLSGDATDPTAERQETQGTGTVLGSMREKTESIANATDLIADSTEQLVNINTGMLRALEAVQSGMLGAAALTARGLADMPAVKPGTGSGFLGGNRYMDEANTIAMAPAFDLVRVSEGMEDIVGWDPLQEIAGWGNDLAGSIMGGGKKVVDEGIKIVGGTLQEAINQTLVSAYATIKTDGGWFGSDKKRDKLIDLPDDVGRQFALTYEAIASSVREGAEAIGLLPADVESALNQFVVDAQTISLEDLDAQEQADELAAMFGVTFDELAGEVVPFLTEFQAAGEGLGETLARVSTQVRVLEEALMTIGGTYDVTPEENAHIANRLSDRLGGTEEFASALTGYENNFLSQAEQFSTLTRRLGDALGDLPLPETRAGFMALIQAQDLLTQEGQDNVATLLRLQGTADDYYSHLEDAANDALASLTGATDTAFSDLQASIRDQKSTLS